MDNEKYTTISYAKLFLLMIIPIYGLCFTILLAFSKDIGEELKSLARGALIARIVCLIVLAVGISVGLIYIIPMIGDFFSKTNILKLFL